MLEVENIRLGKGYSSTERKGLDVEPAWYEIRIERELSPRWADWFGGLEMRYEAECDETILRGELVDQAALFGVLGKVRDLGLTLVAVERIGQLQAGQLQAGRQDAAPTVRGLV